MEWHGLAPICRPISLFGRMARGGSGFGRADWTKSTCSQDDGYNERICLPVKKRDRKSQLEEGIESEEGEEDFQILLQQ